MSSKPAGGPRQAAHSIRPQGFARAGPALPTYVCAGIAGWRTAPFMVC